MANHVQPECFFFFFFWRDYGFSEQEVHDMSFSLTFDSPFRELGRCRLDRWTVRWINPFWMLPVRVRDRPAQEQDQ